MMDEVLSVQEYLQEVQATKTDPIAVRAVEKIYGIVEDCFVMKIVSRSSRLGDSEFFGTDYRALDFREILSPQEHLGVNFPEMGLLPLFDCCNDDFIVYRLKDKKWSMYNITDSLLFMESVSLEELFVA